jgi:hypothetical protein
LTDWRYDTRTARDDEALNQLVARLGAGNMIQRAANHEPVKVPGLRGRPEAVCGLL